MTYFDMMSSMSGYQAKTTFWDDFSIADNYGEKAIEETYERVFKEWKSDYIYLTELVIVLNWKCWEHYEKGNQDLSDIYSKLFYRTQNYAHNNLHGKELSYFLETTD